jgi:lipoprotein LprG
VASRPIGTSRPLPRLAVVSALITGVALLLALAGCGSVRSRPTAPPLPPAADLLSKSASAMAGIRSTSVNLHVDPTLTDIQIRSATGKLTSTGDATGSATTSQGGSTVEFQFVITKGILFFKGPTGKYQPLPLALAARIYDPTVLLNPDRGIPALLRTATNGTTEAQEDVNGAPAYRVRATLSPDLVNSIVPGLSGISTGRVWIDKATSRMVKAQLEVPTTPGQQGGPTAPVTVTLSDFNAPVTIAPPP